jgi:hypothetical protein
MRATIVLVLLLGTAATVTHAAPKEGFEIKSGFLTGNVYRELSPAGKRGYVMGFTDGVLIAPLLDAPKSELRSIERCLVGMTDVQVVAIFDKWLTDNPARWHEQMNILSYSALRQACPRN